MKTLFLSHEISEETPLYGGGSGVSIRKVKSLTRGDSCNTLMLGFPNHTSTHIDAPSHFIPDSKTLSDFSAQDWLFTCPRLLEANWAGPPDLIDEASLTALGACAKETDLLLIRTGFEKFRKEAKYWKKAPGLASSLAAKLKSNFPRLRAVGVDFISISSILNREEGRKAHREFLGREILLIEDMKLSCLPFSSSIIETWVLPLRIKGADGAPVTVVAILGAK